jgi:2-polyprenyl-3-methyl-5-hydroxy-6-metoxy-1,4-benzoquinol methylase
VSDYTVLRADNWQAYHNRAATIPKGIQQVDLCSEPWPFDDKVFEGVVSVDVVEHVENIWAFFRQAFRVAKQFVIIATPNVHSPLSKALYQRNGRFWAFTPGEVKKSVHVTPVFDWQLVEACRRANWEVKRRLYTNEPFKALGSVPPNLHKVAAISPNQRSIIAKMVPR